MEDNEKKPTSPFAVASLVLGIVGVVMAFVPFAMSLSLVLGIVGLVLAIIALLGIQKGKYSGKGIAIAGLALSIVAIVIYVYAYITVMNAVNQTAATLNNVANSYSSIFK